jgi:hypothetical protein
MEDKKLAKMLFKMHLKHSPKRKERSLQDLLDEYGSNDFLCRFKFTDDLNMSEEEKIAYAYPESEFAVVVDDVIVYFTTHYERELVAEEVMTDHKEIQKELARMRNTSIWEQCQDVYIPGAVIYRRPL